jgi:hypothetical protein
MKMAANGRHFHLSKQPLLKKAAQKLLLCWAGGGETSTAQS